MCDFTPELGQMLFGNRYSEHPCPEWLTAMLERLSDEIWRVTHNSTGEGVKPTANEGSQYITPVFSMRSYYWGECNSDGLEDDVPLDPDPSCLACAPNFQYGDFEVRWYKHARRGATMNRKISPEEAVDMFNACMASVLDGEKRL